MNCVGDNDPGAYLPQINTPQITIDTVENVTPQMVLENLGYKFNNPAHINFQKFYLKLGATDKQGLMTLPAMAGLGEGTDSVYIKFDMVPWRTTDAKGGGYDDVDVVVIVQLGDSANTTKRFEVEKLAPEAMTPFKWYTRTIKLDGLKLTKDSRITIRNSDAQFGEDGTTKGLYRFMINDIIVYTGEAPVASGIKPVISNDNLPVEYFNLQGVKVTDPSNGIYIRRQGKNTKKVIIR